MKFSLEKLIGDKKYCQEIKIVKQELKAEKELEKEVKPIIIKPTKEDYKLADAMIEYFKYKKE